MLNAGGRSMQPHLRLRWRQPPLFAAWIAYLIALARALRTVNGHEVINPPSAPATATAKRTASCLHCRCAPCRSGRDPSALDPLPHP